MAISAVDIALWDLKAKLLGVPLADCAAALPRDRPGLRQRRLHDLLARPVCETGSAAGREEGIPRVKIKVGRDRHAISSGVRLAREAVGETSS